MIKHTVLAVTMLSLVLCETAYAQDSLFRKLKIDTAYSYLNFYSNKTARQFQHLFQTAQQEKLVFFHFGGSHIQGDMPTTVVRDNLTKIYGDGGRGMIFPYTVAKTYSSINYSVSYSGKWNYGKSYQIPPPIPIGVAGMAVETRDSGARASFLFKNALKSNDYELKLLIRVDTLTPEFRLTIDASTYVFDEAALANHLGKDFVPVSYTGAIKSIDLQVLEHDSLFEFNFYGIDVESRQPTGVVYHSLGVGAAAFRSVLNIELLPQHASILKPDIVLLDFGTNDILYTNAVDKNLGGQIERSIKQFRDINPDVLVVLTSTQDLFYRRRFISAGITFRNLVDSLARKNDCLFWNWYDLSGGYGTIKTWNDLGYAQKDGVHLTHLGYRLKGEMLFQSMMNTLQTIEKDPGLLEYHVANKKYEQMQVMWPDTSSSRANKKYHKVKSGESLSVIAREYHTSVKSLKSLNGLKSDLIKPGQMLLIRR